MATAAEISTLYNKYLGRDPLQSGIDAWLATGQNIEQIEQGIANSPEAAVRETFSETIGRDPTMEERDFFVNVNPTPIEVVQQVLSGTQEAQQFQTQQQLDETDMLADTTAEDTTAEDVVVDTDDQGSYTVITSRAKGDASSPFGGTAESNETSQLVQMTESELLQEFKDSGQLQDQFGSFENYMGYINDSQEWVQSADWMLANPEYRRSDIESAVIEGEDLGFRPGQKEEVTEKISQDISNARESGYQQWMNEGASILQKWGIQDTIYNEDGDQFKWTGSGYQKTYKVDDHLGPIDYGKMLIATGISAGATPAIAGALGGIGGAALPAGVAGPAAPLIGGKLSTALAAGLSGAAGQLATTGRVDPAAALASAVTAGLNPGGMLAENFGVATGTGVNIVPTNVVGGFVQGATNELVSSAITEGKLDLESALVSGLIDAGVYAASDFLSDASKDSIESEMQRIQDDRDVKRLTNPDLPKLTAEELYAAALTNASVGKSDLGGLVGEGGLLPFIEPVSTKGLNKLLGGGEFLTKQVYVGPDGTKYTDTEALAAGAPNLLELRSAPGQTLDGWTTFEVGRDNTILGDAFDFAKENIPGVIQATEVVSGILDALGTQQFKSTYGATPEEFLAAGVSIEEIQRMVSYGSLEETYNFAVNPRGDSQMVGTLSGIPGLYTTGANNPFLVYGPDSTGADSLQDAINITNIQDAAATAAAANEAAGSVAIVNLSGTETAVSANTVLPGLNITIGEAVLGGFIDGVLVDSGGNTATVSTGGDTTTKVVDSSVVSGGGEVSTGAGVSTDSDSTSTTTNTAGTEVTNITNTADTIVSGGTTLSDTTTTGGTNLSDITTTGGTTLDTTTAGDITLDTTTTNGTTLDTTTTNGTTNLDTTTTNGTTLDTTTTGGTTLDTITTPTTVFPETTVSPTTVLPETTIPPTTVLPTSSGGGGGGGGGSGGGMLGGELADPFGIRPIQITASPALEARLEFPITNFLTQGMFTGSRNKFA
jgi:hypothetical protein